MFLRRRALLCLMGLLALGGQAFGWGADGHHMVGAIADRIIPLDSHAHKQIESILGGLSLYDASVWADCAKGVDPGKNYRYQEGGYPECRVFESPLLEAEMSDFVRRNDTNCDRQPKDESCHKQYHYTNVAIQRDRYEPTAVGAGNHDIVHALAAAIHVLKDGPPAPAPFRLKDKTEALLLVAHYVGDIHQPLHVGTVYLDGKGAVVDPKRKGSYGETDTRGGNLILVNGDDGEKLHTMWDKIPKEFAVSLLDEDHLKRARNMLSEKNSLGASLYNWPATWASQTLSEARQAFAGVKFGSKQQKVCGVRHQDACWSATLPADYEGRMNKIKEEQLVKAGGRLAELLQAIWP